MHEVLQLVSHGRCGEMHLDKSMITVPINELLILRSFLMI